MIASRGGPEVLGSMGSQAPLSHVRIPRKLLIPLTHIHLQVRAPILYGIQNESPPTMDGPPKLFSSGYLHTQRNAVSSHSAKLTSIQYHTAFSRDTVRFLSALCHHLSSSDVFVSRTCSSSETLSEVIADLDSPPQGSFSSSPEPEDHAFKALS